MRSKLRRKTSQAENEFSHRGPTWFLAVSSDLLMQGGVDLMMQGGVDSLKSMQKLARKALSMPAISSAPSYSFERIRTHLHELQPLLLSSFESSAAQRCKGMGVQKTNKLVEKVSSI